jgi:hypothetical protein
VIITLFPSFISSPKLIIFSRVIYSKIIELLEKLNDMEIKITVLKIKDKTLSAQN